MPEDTSPSPYTNPYATTGQPAGASSMPPPPPPTTPDQSATVRLSGPAAGNDQNTRAGQTQPKTNWMVAMILLLVGLVIGGLAGFFVADFFVFKSERESALRVQQELSDRITQLEAQLEAQPTTPTTPGTGTTTPGTGTTPGLSGITADPETASWATYTDAEQRFSFKYPTGYEVREIVSDDSDVIEAVGVYQVGNADPAGYVYVYQTSANDGPDVRDMAEFRWPDLLPTLIKQKSAGAGLANDVTQQSVVLNGTPAIALGAVEGRQTEVTPGGASYQAYTIMDQFDRSYLVGTCSTKTGTLENLVGCPFITTFQLIR